MNLADMGAFLRSRRDRVRPGDAGLPTGLRRDEVAHLAHLSTDYYIELEQGAAQPSAPIVAALAEVLRLTPDEREHLYHLADRPVPPLPGPLEAGPAMLDLLDRLGAVPALVMTDLQVVLAQNQQAVELFGEAPDSTDVTAGFVHRWFTDPAVRAQFPPEDHDAEARTLIADLRAVTARRGSDDATRLISDLCARSPWFVALWNEREVAVRRRELKRLTHPVLGLTAYDCHELFSEDGSRRLVWFVPVSSP